MRLVEVAAPGRSQRKKLGDGRRCGVYIIFVPRVVRFKQKTVQGEPIACAPMLIFVYVGIQSR